MVTCLTSARFNMKADILRSTRTGITEDDAVTPEDEGGQWVNIQDPDTGEIIREWQKNPKVEPVDDDGEPTPPLESFNCLARGIVDGGIRVAGTTERFSELYDGVDYVRIWYPKSVVLNRRDRITNIRDARGNIIWSENERGDGAPTVFNVTGFTPVVDPFGRHIENSSLLERIEVQ